MFRVAFHIALALSAISGSLGAASHRKSAKVCNGRAELCSRPYGNTTFLGSHYSWFVSNDPFATARSQEVDIPSQLDLGVRVLQSQGLEKDGELHFCHSSCVCRILFDGGLVGADYLSQVKTFLDANPNEVLTLLFINRVEGPSLTDLWKPAFDNSGLTPFIYVPPHQPMKRSEWPTLGELIDSGKRVIVFMDTGADGSVDFILPELPMLWEPPTDPTDPSFPCSVHSIDGPLSTEDHLSMLNHNLDINLFNAILMGDRENASTTNGITSILADANGCAPLAGGVAPNFVMLDWVNSTMFVAFQAALALSAISGALGAALPSKRATVCNGHAQLCAKPYGNTTFLGSHDSAFFSENPLALARDQEVDIPSQLNLGVRFLQSQAHECVVVAIWMSLFKVLMETALTGMTGSYISVIPVRLPRSGGLLIRMTDSIFVFFHLCTTGCDLFDGGLVVDYLSQVKTFLDANPNEVLTLLFTNPEGLSLTDMWKPAFDNSGVTPFTYVPPHQPMKRFEWPTLGELIDSGKRVIVFMDAGADGSVDFILPEFTMASLWEPPFDSTDPSFPCSVDRIQGPLSTEDHLSMLNHNLDINLFDTGVLISDPGDAPTTNSVASILADAFGCQSLAGGVAPNFVMLDYVNLGQGMAAVDMLNGI
ncbi:hypothetical protein D9758_015586 [Tetrapyrgos nigripes]|uniref:PLC-like phosphodiesterase n=1 Tax=Tetrapyrgos nigripes TaxID=182062 RepID=A0A8H5CEK9_9AGAR|nr:hypothetical protein D9758_015586 [Tetrapyrgos nigripes]